MFVLEVLSITQQNPVLVHMHTSQWAVLNQNPTIPLQLIHIQRSPLNLKKRKVNYNVVEGERKRARTEKENGNETEMYGYQVQLLTPTASSRPYDVLRSHKITSYHLTEVETKALTNFKCTLFSYTGDRHCAFDLNTTRPTSVTKGLQEYVIHSSSTLNKETQVTEVSYLRVLNRNADDPETILEVIMATQRTSDWLCSEVSTGCWR